MAYTTSPFRLATLAAACLACTAPAASAADVVVAVGNNGTVMRSTDRGATWQAGSSGTTQHLNDVHFINASQGWAVGNGGTLLYSADGGATWQAETSGVSGNLNGVDFVDDQTGWAVGANGKVLGTTDGGQSWSVLSTVGSMVFSKVDFLDANNGWATGTIGLYTTSNGGKNWSVVGGMSGRSTLDVQMFSATAGLVANRPAAVFGTDSTYRTTNGTSWSVARTQNPQTNGVAYGDAQTAYAVTFSEAFRTTDAGASWASVATGAVFISVDTASADEAWAVGYSGAIKHTVNGVNWLAQTSGTTANLNQVDFASGSPVSTVPEPEGYALMLAGLAMLGTAARRRAAKR